MLAMLGLWAAPAEAKASSSCTKALDAAEDIVHVNADFATAVSTHMAGVHDAAVKASRNTGVTLSSAVDASTGFASDVADSVTVLGDTVSDLTDRLGPMVDRYNASAKQCRAGK